MKITLFALSLLASLSWLAIAAHRSQLSGWMMGVASCAFVVVAISHYVSSLYEESQATKEPPKEGCKCGTSSKDDRE